MKDMICSKLFNLISQTIIYCSEKLDGSFLSSNPFERPTQKSTDLKKNKRHSLSRSKNWFLGSPDVAPPNYVKIFVC